MPATTPSKTRPAVTGGPAGAAASASYRLIRRPAVRAAIEAGLHKMCLTPAEILARLSTQATADIGDCLDIDAVTGAARVNLAKLQAIGAEDLISLLPLPHRDTLIEHARDREKAQAAFMQQHPELLEAAAGKSKKK